MCLSVCVLKKDCGIYVSEIADVCLHVSVGVRSHVCVHAAPYVHVCLFYLAIWISLSCTLSLPCAKAT